MKNIQAPKALKGRRKSQGPRAPIQGSVYWIQFPRALPEAKRMPPRLGLKRESHPRGSAMFGELRLSEKTRAGV